MCWETSGAAGAVAAVGRRVGGQRSPWCVGLLCVGGYGRNWRGGGAGVLEERLTVEGEATVVEEIEFSMKALGR